MRTWLLTIIAGLLLIAPSQAADKVVFTSNRTGNADIFVMAPDGTGQANITNSPDETEEFPMWNPDGTKIIYTKQTDNVYTINPDGTGITTANTGGQPIMPAFQTNSTRISFSRSSSFDADVYTANPNGTGQTQITSDFYGDYYARWAPNGTKFTYHTFSDLPDGGGTTPDIYFANPDGSGKVRITTSGENQNATWSPDGGSIVFESGRDGNREIYTMSPYGTIQTRLTNNAFNDTAPVFSPDGKKIMFVSDRDGNKEIYVMNVDGTSQTRVTNNTFDDNFPVWTQVLDASAPTASVNDISVTEGKANNNPVSFTISLSAASATPITVTYRTFDGTANAGSDYVAVPLTTVTFAPGQTSKTVSVLVTGDALNEANETFSIRISALGARIGKQQGVATINNDDTAPTLKIANVTMAEGNTNGTATALVTLSGISGQTVTAQYATSNGTALAGSDYVAKTGTITIAPGQTTATIPVDIIGDVSLEPDEAFYITLSNAVNAGIATNRGAVTLTNDDMFGALSINDVTVAEGLGAKFTVTLSSVSATPVQVKYKTVDATAIAGSDYNAITGTLVIPAGQTTGNITVATRTDTAVELSETFNLVLSDAVNATIADDTGVGTITNTTAPTIYVSDVSLKEGNSGTRFFYFTVALPDNSTVPLNISYSTADGTATAGSDYMATNQTLVFPAGGSSLAIVVPVTPDTVVESNETFLVNVTARVGNSSVASTVTGIGTIVNDDVAPSAKTASRTISGKSY